MTDSGPPRREEGGPIVWYEGSDNSSRSPSPESEPHRQEGTPIPGWWMGSDNSRRPPPPESEPHRPGGTPIPGWWMGSDNRGERRLPAIPPAPTVPPKSRDFSTHFPTTDPRGDPIPRDSDESFEEEPPIDNECMSIRWTCPKPFTGIGQATYEAEKGNVLARDIRMTIFWNEEKIYGKFAMDENFALGYMKVLSEGHQNAEIASGQEIEFAWRGTTDYGQQEAPSSDEGMIDCAKVTLKFYHEYSQITVMISPFSKDGNVDWVRNQRQKTSYLLSHQMSFIGKRVRYKDPNPKEAEKEAEKAWKKFGPEKSDRKPGKESPKCKVS